MTQIIICILFSTNTNTSLHWFTDAEVQRCASKSAEAAYRKNMNVNIALYKRIFPFKMYWQEYKICK